MPRSYDITKLTRRCWWWTESLDHCKNNAELFGGCQCTCFDRGTFLGDLINLYTGILVSFCEHIFIVFYTKCIKGHLLTIYFIPHTNLVQAVTKTIMIKVGRRYLPETHKVNFENKHDYHYNWAQNISLYVYIYI